MTREERRRRAFSMFQAGRSRASVAKRLRVSRQTASRWYDAWKAGRSYRAVRRLGRAPKLSRERRDAIVPLLRRETMAWEGTHGERGLWEHLARVIATKTDVRYTPKYVYRIFIDRIDSAPLSTPARPRARTCAYCLKGRFVIPGSCPVCGIAVPRGISRSAAVRVGRRGRQLPKRTE